MPMVLTSVLAQCLHAHVHVVGGKLKASAGIYLRTELYHPAVLCDFLMTDASKAHTMLRSGTGIFRPLRSLLGLLQMPSSHPELHMDQLQLVNYGACAYCQGLQPNSCQCRSCPAVILPCAVSAER